MNRRRLPVGLFATVLAALACLAPLRPAGAEPPPRALNAALITSNIPYTADQSREMRQYAEGWGNLLAAPPSASDVVPARDKLIEPLQTPGLSAIFRDAYSRALLPALRAALDSENNLAALDAMQIAGFLGTNQSLTLVLEHAPLAQEKRPSVRLWAAKSAVVAIRQGALTGSAVQNAANQLAAAAETETDWFALNSQLPAIASIPAPNSRSLLVSALENVISRVSRQAGPSDLIQAVYPAIFRLRNEYLNLDNATQESLGRQLGPVLGKVLAAAKAHWSAAQNDTQAKLRYGKLIDLADVFLRSVNEKVRASTGPPPAGARQAWDQGDKPGFEHVESFWSTVLSKPPYGR